MRRIFLATAALALLTAAASAPAQISIPQFQVRYTCAKGRFRVSYSSSKAPQKIWHYCWDGTYYSNKTVPAGVREYFENIARQHEASRAEMQAQMAESKRKSEEIHAAANAARAAQGLPSIEESRRQSRERFEQTLAARRNGQPAPKFPTRNSARTTQFLRPTGVVEASSKPEAEPLMPAALQSLTPGATTAEVLESIGEPPGKVSTGEGTESWTYVLTSGAFAKLKFENGALKELILPE